MFDRIQMKMRWAAWAVGILLAWGAAGVKAEPASSGRVAILKDGQAQDAAAALRRAGFKCDFMTLDAACDPASLSAGKYFLYVIPNVQNYPARGAAALTRYLHDKGNLMVLGRPPFGNPEWQGERAWKDPIETVAPGYKTYPLEAIATLKAAGSQKMISPDGLTLPVPTAASSCYGRPQGKGFAAGYKWRWIPLVKALDKDGVERGTAVWLTLNQASRFQVSPALKDAGLKLLSSKGVPRNQIVADPAYEGSAVAVCAVEDPAALKAIARTRLLGDLARRMREGLFLSRGGAEFFAYRPGEKVRLGAVAANFSQGKAGVAVRLSVRPTAGGEAVFERQSDLTIEPGQYADVAFEWAPGRFTTDRYTVTVELQRQGRPIDLITHDVGILDEAKPAADDFVTVKNGDFWLQGKKWYPMGLNFWPRDCIGLEAEDFTCHWLSPGLYDPDSVERDLEQLAALGGNCVCIRVNAPDNGRNLLDFLRRCKVHGIRALVCVSTHEITDDPHYFQVLTMPTHFQEAPFADFVRSTRLAENPTVVGYDIIWEPSGWMFGNRNKWDADWARWIDERYGSLAAAEKDWGMAAPRRDGQVTSPASAQFKTDGPWRVMVCAYRRFMDDLMSRKWNDTARKIRRIDPRHLVGYRQGGFSVLDYTLTATPKHVDFFGMEGYEYSDVLSKGRPGADTAGFVNRYIHFVTRGKPYIWMEYGSSVWDRAAMQPKRELVDIQGRDHELIYRVGLENGANGATSWWLAGGFRIAEKSDFGILNSDGTPRPSALALLKYAPLYKTPREYPKPETWFTMDRDAHAGSHWYIAFHEGTEAYRKATAAGKKLGIRTPGSGITSADTALVAVGNTPYNGHNPPKYLDAEFNQFLIQLGEGHWIEVVPGARIRVPRATAIHAKASVGNLQEATWLTPASCQGRPGAVCLASTGGSELKVRQPIAKDTAWQKDADFGQGFTLSEGIQKAVKVELRMNAEGRAWFGETLRFNLEPAE